MRDLELYEDIVRFQKEINEWEMDLAFAEANTQYNQCVVFSFDGEEL